MQNLRASLAALSAVSGLDLDYPSAGDVLGASGGGAASSRLSPVRDLRSLGDFLETSDDGRDAAPSPDGSDGDRPPQQQDPYDAPAGAGAGAMAAGTAAAEQAQLDEESRFIASLAARYGLSGAGEPLSSSGGRSAAAAAGGAPGSPERGGNSASSVINSILPGISGPSREAIDDLLRDSGLAPLPPGPAGDSPPAMRAALAEAVQQFQQRGRLVQAQQQNVAEARARAARAEADSQRLAGALEQAREDLRAAQNQAHLASEASAAGGKTAADVRKRLEEERAAAAARSKQLEHLVREREMQLQRLSDRLEERVRKEERRAANARKAFDRLRAAAALGGRPGAAAAAAVAREVSPMEIVAIMEEEREQREEHIAQLRQEARALAFLLPFASLWHPKNFRALTSICGRERASAEETFLLSQPPAGAEPRRRAARERGRRRRRPQARRGPLLLLRR